MAILDPREMYIVHGSLLGRIYDVFSELCEYRKSQQQGIDYKYDYLMYLLGGLEYEFCEANRIPALSCDMKKLKEKFSDKNCKRVYLPDMFKK